MVTRYDDTNIAKLTRDVSKDFAINYTEINWTK